VLANHAPLLAMLDACELRLHAADGTVTSYAQGEGYLQVGGNHAMLLVEEAIAASDLDRADLEAKLAARKSELDGLEADSESARAAQRDIRRFEAFLAVGQSE
jgi:F0F1-type ATP synthase epsilon subunit